MLALYFFLYQNPGSELFFPAHNNQILTNLPKRTAKLQEMGKRPAEASVDGADPLKGGERPFKAENGNEEGEFEDEFEDEFESEDEILEAGVDGQPDVERDAEGSRGMWITPGKLCECTSSASEMTIADFA